MKNDDHRLSYSVFDIQDCFEYVIKKHETLSDNPPKRLHVNKIENVISFKVKSGSYPKLLKLETTELLENTENKIN